MSDTPAVKLTKAQREALTRKRFTKGSAGSITSADDRGFSVRIGKSTFYRLLDLRLVEHKALNRFGLSDKGRALLDALKEEGGDGHA